MTFKYEDEMSLLQHCPPSNVIPCDMMAHRFVHEDIADGRNFMCVAKLNPNRKLKPESRCSALGLSMFTTQGKAVKRYRELKDLHPNIGETLGNRLASGTVRPEDGRMTPPGGDGHFDLWEADGVNITDRFEITVDLNG